MECKSINVTREPMNIYFIGDIHEGAANHSEEAFAKAIKIIQEDNSAYWIGLGDYVDCINHHDPRFNPREIGLKYSIRDLDDLPKKQTENVIKQFTKIKDKCLGLISGNHEDSYRKHATFDVVAYMCDHLGVDNLRHKAWISLKEPQGMTYKIVVCHGAGGGGMREGYPVNKAYDVFRWDYADCHVMGHLHQFAADRALFNLYSHEQMRQDKVWFGVSGCFMKKSMIGNDGYFEQKPGKESSIGMLCLSLQMSKLNKTAYKSELKKVYLD